MNEGLNENNEEVKENDKKQQPTFKDLEEQVVKFEEKTNKKFSEFFNTYYPKLVYYVGKICKDEDVAQDLAIESFITGLEKIDKYDNQKAQYSTWLFTIARHGALQWLKENNRFVSMDAKIDENGTSIKDFMSDSADDENKDQDSIDITNMKADITVDCISRLKQPYQKVIEMREIDRLSYKQIASKLGKDVHYEIEVLSNSQFPLPREISNLHDIKDLNGNLIERDMYNVLEGNPEKTPFYTHILITPGTYIISCREPYNLSTLKSQIRNGRKLLEKMVRIDFKKIHKIYGEY